MRLPKIMSEVLSMLRHLIVIAKKVTIRKVNGNPIVDIEGDYVFKEDITEIPFQFGKVTGDFTISYCNNLTSLEGCPEEVGRHFNCGACKNLTSLAGCPEYVGGNFTCSQCEKLTSLEGCPEKVGSEFWCVSCGKQFTTEEVEQLCNVKKSIYV